MLVCNDCNKEVNGVAAYIVNRRAMLPKDNVELCALCAANRREQNWDVEAV
jgi:hypothetical protein